MDDFPWPGLIHARSAIDVFHSKRRIPTAYIVGFQRGSLFPAAQIGLTSS